MGTGTEILFTPTLFTYPNKFSYTNTGNLIDPRCVGLYCTTSLLPTPSPSPSPTGEVLRGDRIVNTPYEVRTLLT